MTPLSRLARGGSQKPGWNESHHDHWSIISTFLKGKRIIQLWIWQGLHIVSWTCVPSSLQ